MEIRGRNSLGFSMSKSSFYRVRKQLDVRKLDAVPLRPIYRKKAEWNVRSGVAEVAVYNSLLHPYPDNPAFSVAASLIKNIDPCTLTIDEPTPATGYRTRSSAGLQIPLQRYGKEAKPFRTSMMALQGADGTVAPLVFLMADK